MYLWSANTTTVRFDSSAYGLAFSTSNEIIFVQASGMIARIPAARFIEWFYRCGKRFADECREARQRIEAMRINTFEDIKNRFTGTVVGDEYRY